MIVTVSHSVWHDVFHGQSFKIIVEHGKCYELVSLNLNKYNESNALNF